MSNVADINDIPGRMRIGVKDAHNLSDAWRELILRAADELDAKTKALEDAVRACESCMNWMEQVSRANLSSATRGILHVDMGMCSTAIMNGKKALAK